MKFFELKVGDKFEFDGKRHIKCKEEKLSCCKVKKNATRTEGGVEDVVLKPLDDVTKIETPTEEN